MGRARLVWLTFVLVVMSTPVSPQDCDWDLRGDFRGEQFPDGWLYQRARPELHDYVDLEWTVLPQSSPPLPDAVGWTDPFAHDESWLVVGLDDVTYYDLPENAVLCHPNAAGREQDWTFAADVVITWVAPSDGVVDLEGFVGHSGGCRPGTDGVKWTVYRNSEMASPLFEATTLAQAVPFSLPSLPVERGDVLRFRANSDQHDGCDHGHLSVCVRYSDGLKFTRGDANGDGRVNIADALYALNWLFASGPVSGCASAANINGDGGVNIADPTHLLNFLFSSGPAPVAPYPACGVSDLAIDESMGCASPPASCRE